MQTISKNLYQSVSPDGLYVPFRDVLSVSSFVCLTFSVVPPLSLVLSVSVKDFSFFLRLLILLLCVGLLSCLTNFLINIYFSPLNSAIVFTWVIYPTFNFNFFNMFFSLFSISLPFVHSFILFQCFDRSFKLRVYYLQDLSFSSNVSLVSELSNFLVLLVTHVVHFCLGVNLVSSTLNLISPCPFQSPRSPFLFIPFRVLQFLVLSPSKDYRCNPLTHVISLQKFEDPF